MCSKCPLQGLAQIRLNFIDYLSQTPMRIVWIALPCHFMPVKENTGAGFQEKFIDLTADIPKVDIGCKRLGHIG